MHWANTTLTCPQYMLLVYEIAKKRGRKHHFVVRDHNGQALTYVYIEQEPGRRY